MAFVILIRAHASARPLSRLVRLWHQRQSELGSSQVRRIDLRKVQAANLHTIRDINRQIVLNYVREKEPISRATIARETALQRSTISEIFKVLTGEGLVEEIGEGKSTGGRRPTLLRLRTVGAI